MPTGQKRNYSVCFAACLAICALTAVWTSRAQTLAFPGALGFGCYATGGRYGAVYHVTNLNDSGTGSFRDAVSQPNRIIVFDVGGTITLASAVSCSSSLTIAGQTAPGGLAIIGHEVSFSVQSNCIVRYLRIRPGTIASSTEDAIDMGDGTNLIFDHLSLEFAPYNTIDAHGNYTDGNQITVQNSILADPIGQQFNAHTEALYNTFSWFYNIFSSGHDRNPLAKVNNIFVNNVIYNFQAGYTCANTSGSFSHDIVNNYFIMGPGTTDNGGDAFFQFDTGQSVYASGNLEDTNLNGTLVGSIITPTNALVLNSPWSSLTAAIPTCPTATAYHADVSLAGVLPRDQVDQLVINDVSSLGTIGVGQALWTNQTATGLGNDGYGIITPGSLPADADGDGMPDFWKAAVGLPLNTNEAMVIASDGYANIEHYLNWLASPNAVTLTNTSVNIDLTSFTAGFTNDSPVYSVNNPTNGVVALNSGSIAQFMPKTNFSGLGSFNFAVLANDGSIITSTVTVCVSPLIVTQSVVVPAVPPNNIFVALRTTSTGPSTSTIAPPAGYSYSAAAPVSGTTWNTVDLENVVGTNSIAGTASNLYANLALENASGVSIAPTLSITYSNVISTSTRTQPSGGNGENILQPGGVMADAWRNYYNASGNYFTFTISGLSSSSPYDLYLEGGTTGSGQGAGVALVAANSLGSNPTNAVTPNTTTNSNGSFGSLWTVSGSITNLMPRGTTWTVLHGQSDASGHFSFLFNGLGGSAYLNGFQLVPISINPSASLLVELVTSSGIPSTTTINPPAGYVFTAAASVSGTTWNTVGLSSTIPGGTTSGTYPLYSGLSLKDSSNNLVAPTLSVAYVVPSGGTTLAGEPQGGNVGENTLQPGGVMQNAWRNYDNAAGKYFVFTISNLPALTPFGLYFYGGTLSSGYGAQCALLPANALGSNPTNALAPNTTTNSNGSYGSIWTMSAGTTNLMPQGTVWNVLYGKSDTNGSFAFQDYGTGSYAYLNGFQLVPLSALYGNSGPAASFPEGISLGNDGNVRFTYTGSAGENYRIWATTNLILTPITNKWTQLTNGAFNGNTNSFKDMQSTNFPRRFYIISLP